MTKGVISYFREDVIVNITDLRLLTGTVIWYGTHRQN